MKKHSLFNFSRLENTEFGLRFGDAQYDWQTRIAHKNGSLERKAQGEHVYPIFVEEPKNDYGNQAQGYFIKY